MQLIELVRTSKRVNNSEESVLFTVFLTIHIDILQFINFYEYILIFAVRLNVVFSYINLNSLRGGDS